MKKIEKAISLVNAAKTVAVFSHAGYDGDAIGSMFGLAEFLKKQGKKVDLFLDSTISQSHALLFDPKLLTNSPKKSYDLAIMTDCTLPSRLGKFEELYKSQKHTLRLDHHKGIYKQSTVEITKPYASASEVVLEFIEQLGKKPNKKTATYLYAGLISDTAGFMTSNVTAKTFENALKLIKFGADLHYANEVMLKTNSFALEKLRSRIFKKVKFVDSDVAISSVTQKDLKSLHLTYDEISISGELCNLIGVNISCLLKEKAPKTFSCSFRCKRGYNVSKIAESLGGGGHLMAAACVINGSLKEAEAKVIKAIRENR